MTRLLRRTLLLVLLLCIVRPMHAIEVRVSAQALERTLRAQLFNGPDGRYYIRGNASSPCFVYAESPRVSFKEDRIVVHVHTRSRLGTGLRGTCLGVTLSTDADVSLIPEAQGETVGFRDARIERLSESRELNFLLVPFLSRELPSQMKINASGLMRQLLSQSDSTTGYTLTLNAFKLHSMLVEQNALVIDLDASMNID